MVEEVRQQDMAIVLEKPTAFVPDRPILCNGAQLAIIHHDSDCLWVEDAQDVKQGMTLAQPAHIGTEDELFHLFLETWKEMWGRHQDVSPERWHTILEFARAHLPRHHMCWNPMDP